ncbi:RES family NAD+ phosphorylase [Sphingosinicella rhizophila]|uniref:RES family NAD+ phosphorylase n=1 Tax=Sphingosinicella rhizophila TaxID=3050082 RepID=A0ABU3QC64_9SPHN|nr:RES family NAD+ phosphorylase [Sphingosinicella sp. GR2756]MDT9600583.1 RES family NAD+ phosphorylase [Sphingosinicella sp. GR2756]
MKEPPVRLIRQYDTHRLIPSKYGAGGDSVLVRVASGDDDLQAIFDLDHATNDRLLGENDLLPGIDTHELLFALPYSSIVNAAFCHAQPLGSRFNGPDRGAWYAAFELHTAQAEVAFHKEVELAEIGWMEEAITYDDYLADFSGDFHDLRGAAEFDACLNPLSYVAGQDLAEQLLAAGSLGIAYPSVRSKKGSCLACFRPALVTNVRKASTWRFSWDLNGRRVVEEATV